MSLSKESLGLVCAKHRELNAWIRKAQIKMAVWRAFIYMARKLKAERKRRERRKGGAEALQHQHSSWDAVFENNDAEKVRPELMLLQLGHKRHGFTEHITMPAWASKLQKNAHWHSLPRRAGTQSKQRARRRRIAT
eukprot:gb/GFBE01051325.1/.p1 GENE.gb/GFBE01051325.1/~~gb/GFBE01051325.1/.p1  ORF type:complete len:136 (+),score=17.82 gb/GFBE01051325.1/:1-408(+)